MSMDERRSWRKPAGTILDQPRKMVSSEVRTMACSVGMCGDISTPDDAARTEQCWPRSYRRGRRGWESVLLAGNTRRRTSGRGARRLPPASLDGEISSGERTPGWGTWRFNAHQLSRPVVGVEPRGTCCKVQTTGGLTKLIRFVGRRATPSVLK